MKSIDVTCAIILKDNKVLACLRGEGKEHANEWEFPGGKVEENETEEECLIRELKEELHIEINVLRRLKSVHHFYEKVHIHLIPFLCEISLGEPVLSEHKKVIWQPITRLDVLNWSEADRKLIQLNIEEIIC